MNHAEPAWLVHGRLLTPTGIRRGAVGIRGHRIVEVSRQPSRSGRRVDARGCYIVPGLIDLHVWGDPDLVARDAVRAGTTAFLSAIGPASPEELAKQFVRHAARRSEHAGAECLGIHLEGPFINPARGGALASRWLRPPRLKELSRLHRAGRGALKLVTIAPELPGGARAIRWCAAHGVVASLGHSAASAEQAATAAEAGARAVTHVFNGMAPLHHRHPGLMDAALTDDRLTAMVILDGVHVSPQAFQLLVRCKGPARIVLVTDSIRRQAGSGGPRFLRSAQARGGAFYTTSGRLAGSRLTMLEAVRNAARFGKMNLADAVRMATANPARLLGMERERGALLPGRRADLAVFDERFRVRMTWVAGRIVYQRG